MIFEEFTVITGENPGAWTRTVAKWISESVAKTPPTFDIWELRHRLYILSEQIHERLWGVGGSPPSDHT